MTSAKMSEFLPHSILSVPISCNLPSFGLILVNSLPPFSLSADVICMNIAPNSKHNNNTAASFFKSSSFTSSKP